MDVIIRFKPMKLEDLSLWFNWARKPHVSSVWFKPGYDPPELIYKVVEGNGYEYPFIIYYHNVAIGFISCADLYAYGQQCNNPNGLFAREKKGTFCMDLYIGEEDYLDKGIGTTVVKTFKKYIFNRFDATKIYIDPASSNKRAIRCYEKAGFQFVKEQHDGVTACYIMVAHKRLNDSN